MKRKILAILVVLGLIFGLTVTPAAAQPTQDDVKAAIANGVAWLADQQNPNGSWGTWEVCAVTALAVKKLEHHAVDPKWGYGLPSPFHEDYPYREHVEKGLNYLFANCASTMPITPQPAGDPDTDGDGLGVYFGALGHRTYTTAAALMAICEAVEMDRVVESGPLAGWLYAEVAEDTMNYLAFGQNDGGNERGGWGYSENYIGWSDQSNSGYVVLALGFYEAAPPYGFGQPVPQFVKDELNIWIDYIQNDVSGGSGYNHPDSWVNILKTGNLLQQMAFVGDTADTPRAQAALQYMCDTWADPSQDPGWSGGAGTASYQTTFTAMKGFTSLGIHEILPCGIDWQADFETELLEEQLADGSWPITNWDYGGNRVLSTIWALLTLQKVAPPPFIPVPLDIKPQSCPNPLNVNSKGVLPVAILGTEEFDVIQVDPVSVCLTMEGLEVGVSPLRWSLEDVATPYEPYLGKESCMDCTEEGPDGYMDLTLKFDAQEVVETLGLDELEDGSCVVIQINGKLKEEFDGMAILGEDVVRIINKK